MPSSRSPKSRPPLRIAMIGHAFMGRAHSNAFRQAGHFFDLPFEVVPQVVVGRDAKRAEAARGKLGFLESSAHLDEVLAREDIDVVDIATPNDTHAPLAIAALKAGKHVLCEKPLALDLKSAKTMLRAAQTAQKNGARVGVWHNYRRAPATTLAHRIISRGDLGKIRQVRAVYLQDWLSSKDAPWSWRNHAATCGSGAHGDLNAHLIDLTRYLTGLEFDEVCGMQETFTRRRVDGSGKRRAVDVDDAFCFLAKLSNGALGTFEATRTAPGRKNHNQIEVHGERGSLLWDLERMNELQVFLYDEPNDVQGYRRVLCNDDCHPYAPHWWPDGHHLGYEHTFVHTFVDFCESLASKKRFRPDFEDGIAVQAVLDAAMKSATTGRFTKVAR